MKVCNSLITPQIEFRLTRVLHYIYEQGWKAQRSRQATRLPIEQPTLCLRSPYPRARGHTPAQVPEGAGVKPHAILLAAFAGWLLSSHILPTFPTVWEPHAEPA